MEKKQGLWPTQYYASKVVFSTNKDISLHMHNPSKQEQKINSGHCYYVILRLYLRLASGPHNITLNKIQFRIRYCI